LEPVVLGNDFLEKIERFTEEEGEKSPGPVYTGSLTVRFFTPDERLDKVIELDEAEEKYPDSEMRKSLERTKQYMKLFRERVVEIKLTHYSGKVFTDVEKFLETEGASRLFVRLGTQLIQGVPVGND
jgi:hypothetical protein